MATHGQKGFNGVALLSRLPFDETQPRLAGDDEDVQARFLEGVVSPEGGVLRIACLYLPNGNPPDTDKYPYKLKWMKRLADYSSERLKTEEPFVLAGDFNVIPAAGRRPRPGGLGRRRAVPAADPRRFRALTSLGLTDALRAVTDEPRRYTFWDYQAGAWQKNNGIRIDHLLLSPQAADRLVRRASTSMPAAGKSRPTTFRSGSIWISRPGLIRRQRSETARKKRRKSKEKGPDSAP